MVDYADVIYQQQKGTFCSLLSESSSLFAQ